MGAPLEQPNYRSFCGLLSVKTATDFVASFVIALSVCIIYHNYGSTDLFTIYCTLFNSMGIFLAVLTFYGVDTNKAWALIPFMIYNIVVSIASFGVFTTAGYGSQFPQIVCDYATGKTCDFEQVEALRERLHRVMQFGFIAFLVFFYFAWVIKKCYRQIKESAIQALPVYVQFK